MKMKWIAILLFVSGSLVAAAERKIVSGKEARTERSDRRLSVSSGEGVGRGVVHQASSDLGKLCLVAPQVYRLSGTNVAWAVVTENLPAGAKLTLVYEDPYRRTLQNQTLIYDKGLQAGESLNLPDVRAFGHLWTRGVHTYDIFVELPDGSVNHCAADFTSGDYYRIPEEIAKVVPLIRTYQYEKGDDGSIFLVVKGVFAQTSLRVIIEDVIVPPRAVVASTIGEFRVNLNAVPGFSRSDLSDYFLTVAQDGWTDTLPIRFWPQ